MHVDLPKMPIARDVIMICKRVHELRTLQGGARRLLGAFDIVNRLEIQINNFYSNLLGNFF